LTLRIWLRCESHLQSNQHSTHIYRPIALRQGIRDHVESPSSELAVQFKSLEESVGYPVVFDPDWSMIWEILKPNYPDQATFIPSIAGIVCGWCKAIADWIEDSEVLDDFGGFLALLNERLKLLLEVGLSF